MDSRTEQRVDKLLKRYKCPECGASNLNINWSPCYDPECCGLDDRIYCDERSCFWETEGQWDRYSFEDMFDLLEDKT